MVCTTGRDKTCANSEEDDMLNTIILNITAVHVGIRIYVWDLQGALGTFRFIKVYIQGYSVNRADYICSLI